MRASIGFLLLLAMAGCHTPYTPRAAQEDYLVQTIGPNSFLIQYQGEAGVAEERIVDFGLLRACHVVREHGFDYFALVDVAHSTPEQTVFGRGPLREDLREGLVAYGFESRPKGVFVFKATDLEDMIRMKYQAAPSLPAATSKNS